MSCLKSYWTTSNTTFGIKTHYKPYIVILSSFYIYFYRPCPYPFNYTIILNTVYSTSRIGTECFDLFIRRFSFRALLSLSIE